MELTARRHHVLARGQQPAHDVDVAALGHVEDGVGVEGDDGVDVAGRQDARGPVEAAELAGVAARLVGAVDPQPGELQSRVLDHGPEGT